MKNSKTLSYKKTFEKKLFLRYLLMTNQPAVYALVNEKDKKIFIGCSNDPIKALGAHIAMLANRTHNSRALRKDRNKLKMIILCHCESKYKEIHKLIEIDAAIKRGYTLYNIENLPKYKVRIRLVAQIYAGHGYKVKVQLVNKGKRVFNVASFNTRQEAEEWLKLNDNIYDMLKMVVDSSNEELI